MLTLQTFLYTLSTEYIKAHILWFRRNHQKHNGSPFFFCAMLLPLVSFHLILILFLASNYYTLCKSRHLCITYIAITIIYTSRLQVQLITGALPFVLMPCLSISTKVHGTITQGISTTTTTTTTITTKTTTMQ